MDKGADSEESDSTSKFVETLLLEETADEHQQKTTLQEMHEKVKGALTACLSPIPNCSVLRNVDDKNTSKMEIEIDNLRAKQKDALRRMEEGIKHHMSIALGKGSLVPDDEEEEEEDDDLLVELAPNRCSDSIESECLNSIGEATIENIENRKVEMAKKRSGGGVLGDNTNVSNSTHTTSFSHAAVKHLPGSYKQSAKSKFDYYRKHRAFGGDGALRPIGESSNEQREMTSSSDVNFSSRTTSTRTTSAVCSTAHVKELNLALDAFKTQQRRPEEVLSNMASPASKRNELAKQILKRRQLQPSQIRIQVEP